MPSQSLEPEPTDVEGTHRDEDLTELLQELRILLPGAQVLMAFLVILPFSAGFEKIQRTEQWIYVATFACSVVSLALFTAPAAQHRLERPLRDRTRFKHEATRLIILGLIPLSVALILATQLVVSQVVGSRVGYLLAGVVGGVIVLTWWLLPLRHRNAGR
jgi:Na+/melibiose symporter-like transporter